MINTVQQTNLEKTSNRQYNNHRDNIENINDLNNMMTTKKGLRESSSRGENIVVLNNKVTNKGEKSEFKEAKPMDISTPGHKLQQYFSDLWTSVLKK